MRVEKADKPHGSVRYCGMYVCIYIYIYTIGDIAAYVRARAVKKSWERPCRLWKKGIRTDFFFFCRKKKKSWEIRAKEMCGSFTLSFVD